MASSRCFCHIVEVTNLCRRTENTHFVDYVCEQTADLAIKLNRICFLRLETAIGKNSYRWVATWLVLVVFCLFDNFFCADWASVRLGRILFAEERVLHFVPFSQSQMFPCKKGVVIFWPVAKFFNCAYEVVNFAWRSWYIVEAEFICLRRWKSCECSRPNFCLTSIV